MKSTSNVARIHSVSWAKTSNIEMNKFLVAADVWLAYNLSYFIHKPSDSRVLSQL